MWPTASFMGVPLRKGQASGPGLAPRSGAGRLTVRTLYTWGSTSRVLSSEKPPATSAWHVRCTCSMQGEKEQKRPPAAGRTLRQRVGGCRTSEPACLPGSLPWPVSTAGTAGQRQCHPQSLKEQVPVKKLRCE